MKTAVCHYSYRQLLNEKGWSIGDFLKHASDHGIEGADFHQRFLPSAEEAPELIQKSLEGSGMVLSGLSLSTNFNREGEDFTKEVETALSWIKAAGEAGAEISRVFGGHVPDRTDGEAVSQGLKRIMEALQIITPAAEEAGVVLAIENHGGLPGTGEEQIEVIEKIGSPGLRATVDVGNYLMCGQDPIKGSSIAAPYCAYIHFKDFKKIDKAFIGSVIGEGIVDHAGCLNVLKDGGYDGFVALEFEGEDVDPLEGIEKSYAYMKKVVGDV